MKNLSKILLPVMTTAVSITPAITSCGTSNGKTNNLVCSNEKTNNLVYSNDLFFLPEYVDGVEPTIDEKNELIIRIKGSTNVNYYAFNIELWENEEADKPLAICTPLTINDDGATPMNFGHLDINRPYFNAFIRFNYIEYPNVTKTFTIKNINIFPIYYAVISSDDQFGNQFVINGHAAIHLKFFDIKDTNAIIKDAKLWKVEDSIENAWTSTQLVYDDPNSWHDIGFDVGDGISTKTKCYFQVSIEHYGHTCIYKWSNPLTLIPH